MYNARNRTHIQTNRILGVTPSATLALNMTLARDCVCPVVVTRGADQVGAAALLMLLMMMMIMLCGFVCFNTASFRPTPLISYPIPPSPPHPNPNHNPTQTPMSTAYDTRLDPSNVRNYGRLIVELAGVVPDGLVVFFVSYSYMDYVISKCVGLVGLGIGGLRWSGVGVGCGGPVCAARKAVMRL